MKTLINRLLLTRPTLDAAISLFDKKRLKLPTIRLDRYLNNFGSVSISVTSVPIGPWSSPLTDVVMICKLAACTEAKTILEVGSYQGYTALALAENSSAETTLTAIDRDPRHGAAYRANPLSKKIRRIVADFTPACGVELTARGFDLIFIDAGHHYRQVESDTKTALSLLSPTGYLVWHDYANWGRFSGKNGVPEFLNDFSKSYPTFQIAGTWLAAYSPSWIDSDSPIHNAKIDQTAYSGFIDPWQSEVIR